MKCLRCGAEIAPEQVFCPECLASMADYPVKPGAVVNIPVRRETAAPVKRMQASPEQLLERSRRLVKLLTVSLLLLALAAGIAGVWGGITLERHYRQSQRGQNYSTAATTD